jgi:hypothetical protein
VSAGHPSQLSNFPTFQLSSMPNASIQFAINPFAKMPAVFWAIRIVFKE